MKNKKPPAANHRGRRTLSIKRPVAYAILTSTAFIPFLPRSVLNVTWSPSRMLSINPLTCTKISSWEELSTMKPNPLDSLKNFTVPLYIGKN